MIIISIFPSITFNSFIESAFRPTLDVLDDWKEQTQLAHEAANEGDWNRVLALSSASIQLYPGGGK